LKNYGKAPCGRVHSIGEDLVQLLDVSVAGKYDADLTLFTRVVTEDMHSMLDSFKQDLNSSLPRQVRALVQQIQGEDPGKRLERSLNAGNPGHF
jgi:hypothetical protein